MNPDTMQSCNGDFSHAWVGFVAVQQLSSNCPVETFLKFIEIEGPSSPGTHEHCRPCFRSAFMQVLSGLCTLGKGSFLCLKKISHFGSCYHFGKIPRPDTSRRQRRRLPPCPLVIALVPLKCSSRNFLIG